MVKSRPATDRNTAAPRNRAVTVSVTQLNGFVTQKIGSQRNHKCLQHNQAG